MGLPGLRGQTEVGEYEVYLWGDVHDLDRKWCWRVYVSTLGWQTDSSVYPSRKAAILAAEADCAQRQTREIDAANWQILTTETVTPPPEEDPHTWGAKQRQNFNELVSILNGRANP